MYVRPISPIGRYDVPNAIILALHVIMCNTLRVDRTVQASKDTQATNACMLRLLAQTEYTLDA